LNFVEFCLATMTQGSLSEAPIQGVQRSFTEIVGKGVTRALSLESVVDCPPVGSGDSFSGCVAKGFTHALSLESVGDEVPNVACVEAPHDASSEQPQMLRTLSQAISNGVTRSLSLESVSSSVPEKSGVDVCVRGELQVQRSLSQAVSKGVHRALSLESIVEEGGHASVAVALDQLPEATVEQRLGTQPDAHFGTQEAEVAAALRSAGQRPSLLRLHTDTPCPTDESDAAAGIMSLADLTNAEVWRPLGVDPLTREMHLSDEEFQSVLCMPSAQFHGQPKWKQDSQKKAKGLF